MWFAPATSVAVIAVVLLFGPPAALVAWPLMYLWLVSPIVGWWLSRPLKPAPSRLSDGAKDLSREAQAAAPGGISKTFVTEQEKLAPADNFQQHPSRFIAPRTSPTNIGDLAVAGGPGGLRLWIIGSAARLIDRTGKTFGTLAKMQRYRGHFYNWYYDTRSLQPLLPMYVSWWSSGATSRATCGCCRQGLLELTADTDMANGRLPARLFSRSPRHRRRVLLDAARAASSPRQSESRRLPVPAPVLRKIERI